MREHNAVDLVHDMAGNGYICSLTANRILESLFAHEEFLNFEGSDPEYIAKLCTGLASSSSQEAHLNRIEKSTPIILTNYLPKRYLHSLKVLLAALRANFIKPTDLITTIREATVFGATESELELLGTMIGKLELHDIYDVSQEYYLFVKHLVSNDLDGLIDDTDLFYYGSDLHRAHRELDRLITKKLLAWGVEATQEMLEEIVDGYDLEERMYSYFASQCEEEHPQPFALQTDDKADVDDLFQRDRMA